MKIIQQTISKIICIISIIYCITYITLLLLSIQEREGYLENIKLNIEETLLYNNIIYKVERIEKKDENIFYILNKEYKEDDIIEYIHNNIEPKIYTFKIGYYNKFFRNNDIYDVYIDSDNILQNNKEILSIKMNNRGSPFGSLVSKSKLKESEKIGNILYTLRIKLSFSTISIISMLLFFIIILLLNINNISNNKIYYLLIFIILIFSISVRLYWVNKKEYLYVDELYSLLAANNTTLEYENYYKKFDNTKGEEVFKNTLFNDKSKKDLINDIKSLYYDSKDPYISNLYYTLLRIMFVNKSTYNINEIALRNTILNCIFFIFTFVFLLKILNIIFEDKRFIILFSLLILSLNPQSITFSIFIRPYQMQEAFFVSILYIVINTIIYNNYSIKNFIINTIITGLGYLTLSSSLVYILVISFLLLLYFTIQKLIKRENFYFANINIKTLIYFALSFNLALLLSNVIYLNFYKIIFMQNQRSSRTIKGIGSLFNYINKYSFDDLLPFIIGVIIAIIIFSIDKKYNLIRNIQKEKLQILIFIITIGTIFSIISHILAPYDLPRYSANGYMLILFIIPMIISIFNNKYIQYILLIFISSIYIYNITNYKRISYLIFDYDNRAILQKNIHVYSYKDFIKEWGIAQELRTNLIYTHSETIHELQNKINKYNSSNFYLIVNRNDTNILTNNVFNKYEKYTIRDKVFYTDKAIYELKEINCNISDTI